MKFQVYFVLGTSLSCFPGLALGQCIPAQDCAALGYTESSCDGGNGVKCPFGNGWFCAEDESTVCAENGFEYSCTGTGYAGGAGSACGGKYAQCTCASGYEWKDGVCQKKEVLNGVDGDVYKCNGKVVGIKTGDMNFYVAMNDLGEMTWTGAASRCQNYSFCGNLKGTLPTKDQLLTMYNNKSSLNSLLSTNGGTNFSNGYYWSSTFYDYYGGRSYGLVSMSDGNVRNSNDYSTNYNYVRPVLTSY